MYNLITAFALPQGIGQGWSEVDLSTQSLSQIRDTYAQVHLHCKHTVLTGTMRMLLQTILDATMDHGQTIASFFANNGNKTLTTYRTLASIKKGEVIYRDIHQAGYSIEPINRLYGIGNVHQTDNATDGWMVKEGVDPLDFKKHCLAVVNGLIHIVDADKDGIYIKDAYTSVQVAGTNHVGVINLKNVSSFECAPLTDAMMFAGDDKTVLGDKVYIKIPVAKKDKMVALVAGGYLHLLDPNTFFRVNDTTYCFEIRNIDFLDRFLESELLIDMSSLGLERSGRSNKQLSREELHSDAVIRKWLKLSQSFLIYFDNPYISKEKIHVNTDSLPGMYTSAKEPTLPLFHLKGLIGVYWKMADTDLWEMRTGNNRYRNYLHHTTSKELSPNPADNAVPFNTVRLSVAHFLKISTSTLVLA